MAVRRAYDQSAKDRRRQEIIDAADRIFAASLTLPTAARLAEEAGLAKGTLYLYFESREAVYAALLLERWTHALAELEEKLSCGTRAGAVDAVLQSFVTLIDSKPMLMVLDAMLPQLRQGMSEETRRHFSQSLGVHMGRVGAAIERELDLEQGRGFQLLVRSQAFARGLWQACDADDGRPGEDVATLLHFSTELRDALSEYWQGVISRRDDRSRPSSKGKVY